MNPEAALVVLIGGWPGWESGCGAQEAYEIPAISIPTGRFSKYHLPEPYIRSSALFVSPLATGLLCIYSNFSMAFSCENTLKS